MGQLYSGLLAVFVVLASACSAPIYTSAVEKDSAKVTFYSLSDPLPELTIGLRGKTFSIGHDMFETRKPDTQIRKVFTIPANEQIVLTYETFAIRDVSFSPVITSHITWYVDTRIDNGITEPTLGYQIDFEEQHSINTCSKKIAFTSEKDKNYEVFVEQSAGNICAVYVREEVTGSADSRHKIFKQLKTKLPVS